LRIHFKVLRFANIAYNEPAALDARRRIATFFRTRSGEPWHGSGFGAASNVAAAGFCATFRACPLVVALAAGV
jgi:hypothetical protein